MFHGIISLFQIVSSLSCNFNRYSCRLFSSFMTIACRSTQKCRAYQMLYNRVVTRYMGSGLKAQNRIGIRAQRKGLRAHKNGSGITRLLSPNQGSDLLHGLKLSYHNIFPHNKVCVHRTSWPRYITHSCFRLTAVPVIRSPGCLTKTWYHILNLLIVEGTVI